MTDIVSQIDLAHRELRTQGKARTVLLRHTFDADVADACTTAERISRWVAPVTGDLRLGGTYQLQGNARGEVLECEPPQRLRVSWVYGENPATNTSEVEVRLTDTGDGRTVLELEHVAVDVDPDFWRRFGPGATGIGWDLALLGLASHLAGSASSPRQRADRPRGGQPVKVRSGRRGNRAAPTARRRARRAAARRGEEAAARPAGRPAAPPPVELSATGHIPH